MRLESFDGLSSPILKLSCCFGQKIVLKFDLPDDDIYKTKALDIVCGSSGVDSVLVEIEEKKLTVTGDIDVVEIESKLRKICPIEIVYVGPANEPEKKKKEEAKKFGEKNDTAMSICTVEVDCGGTNSNFVELKMLG